MSKKFGVLLISLLLVGIFSTLALGAKVTVTQWNFPLLANEMEVLWKPLIEKFEAQNPDIEIKVEILPWGGRAEKLLTAVAAKRPPDVAYLNEFFLQMFAARGALIPLEKYLSREALARYPESLIDAVTYNGHVYLAPALVSTVGYLYNLRVLKKVGWDVNKLPETWDDLLKLCKMVKEYAMKTGEKIWTIGYPASMEDTLNMTLYPLIWQAGGDVLTPDLKKAAFNSWAGIKALTFVKLLFDEGYAPKDLIQAGLSTNYFLNDEIAMWFGADAWGVSQLLAEDPNLADYAKFGPILKENKKITYGTMGAWAIFRGSRNPKAAAKWVEFLISPENNTFYNKTIGYMSPLKGAPPLYADNPFLGVLETQKVFTRGGLIVKDERRVMDVIKEAQQAVIVGQKTVIEALNDAEKEVNFILEGF
ncbi:ABC transporter substrate-binding protein [Kosmotoga olearia]|uniref:Extracellular solute-binding protein family 1 n=1 Tax=Kosmotoga olearia (strain ATCC BAA-1733 / DSM 21960 / TBF 19.5.1) TaxID=521045 RepID=C5CFH7_KOSOT|nr:sugar ABC transporter substrate-binding protein [Kosmotoga olearia]ACR79395.1 extracellular solute-binding protein family 1 [Kosmotoga olearia TBF 19.5.1]